MHRLVWIFVLIAAAAAGTVTAQQQNTDVVAEVTRIQEAAVALQDALPRTLEVGSEVQLGDIISTGPGARLKIVFTDGTEVTLGERTTFSVVEFVMGQNGGNAVMRIIEGAFAVTSGGLMELADSSFTVETETATIGIRGTTFWGGVLDSGFEVALLDGKGVFVKTEAGRVELTEPGTGTRAAARGMVPSEPLPWAQQKIDRAVATVAFDQ